MFLPPELWGLDLWSSAAPMFQLDTVATVTLLLLFLAFVTTCLLMVGSVGTLQYYIE